jgi:hypothetical protein
MTEQKGRKYTDRRGSKNIKHPLPQRNKQQVKQQRIQYEKVQNIHLATHFLAQQAINHGYYYNLILFGSK